MLPTPSSIVYFTYEIQKTIIKLNHKKESNNRMSKIIKKIVTAFLFMLIVTGGDLFAENNKVPHYSLELKGEPENGKVKGRISIEVPLENSRHIYKDKLYIIQTLNSGEAGNPHINPALQDSGPVGFDPTWSKISELTVNGKKTDYQFVKDAGIYSTDFNEEHLFLQVDISPFQDNTNIVTVAFEYEFKVSNSDSGDDYYYKDLLQTRFSWFPALQPSDINIKNIPMQSYEFTYDGTIDLPESWQMAAIGTGFTEKTGTFRFESTEPVMSLPLIFMKNYKIYERDIQNGALTLRVYHRTGAESTALQTFLYSQDVLDYYRDTYYPLAYKNVSVIQGGSFPGGMAADSICIIGDMFFGKNNMLFPGISDYQLDYLVIHELGHFYFGIGASPDFSRDNYISEGLNEYSSLKYFEAKYGMWDNAVNYNLQDILVHPIRFIFGSNNSSRGNKTLYTESMVKSGWDGPISKDPDNSIRNASQTLDYDKSVFVMTMLEEYIGKEQFAPAFNAFVTAYEAKNVATSDFKEFLEEYLNRDLDNFFNTYIHGTGSVDYSITGKLNTGMRDGNYISNLAIEGRVSGDEFIPCTLTVFTQNGEVEYRITQPGDMEIETDTKVEYVSLDNNLALLDSNRKNNVFPMQLEPQWGGSSRPWLKYNGRNLYNILPYLRNHNDGSSTYGLGLAFIDDKSWNTGIGGALNFGTGQDNSTTLSYGGFVSGSWNLSPFTSLQLSSLILNSGSGIVKTTTFGLNHFFMLPIETGHRGYTYQPVIGLSVNASLEDLDLASPDKAYVSGTGGLSFNFNSTSGTHLGINNSFAYSFNTGGFENRIGASLTQIVPTFIPKVALGLQVSGNAGFGDLSKLQAGNSVLGWRSNAAAGLHNSLKGKAFLGMPLFNGLDITIFNSVILQSINGGFIYEIAGAFDTPGDISSNYQHAAGFELVSTFKTIFDFSTQIAAGISVRPEDIISGGFSPDKVKFYVSFSPDILAGMYSKINEY